MIYTFHKEGFAISTDQKLLNIDLIHRFLATTYWAKGITKEIVSRSIAHSLCFGLYKDEQQIGFARVVTDFATFGYIGDVFIVEEFRGKGLSKWMMQCITQIPELQNFRRWLLATRDAHGLYAKVGFKPVKHPDRWMEIHNQHVYDSLNPNE